MSKLVTVEQLKSAMEKLLEQINSKLSATTENDTIPVSGNVSFTYMDVYGTDSGILFTNKFSGDSVTLTVDQSSTPSNGNILVSDSNGYTNDLRIDGFMGGGSNGNGSLKYYCLPTSSTQARTLATVSGTAGGILLTSRNRSYEKLSYTVASGEANDVYPDPYTYTVVEANGGIAVQFPISSGSIEEYWIEIIIPDTINAPRPYTSRPVTFYGQDILWSDGEPDWAELSSVRVQIHILNGIATYVTVPYNDGSNNNSPIENGGSLTPIGE